MAMFGDAMTDVITPDGRRLTVPQQFAAQYPDLRPAPPLGQETSGPAPIGPPAAPAWGPSDTGALAAQTPSPDVTSSPVTSPAQVPQPGPPASPQGPTTGPAQAMPDDNASAPPVTSRQLAGMGPAGVANLENRALDQGAAATRQLGQAQADEATRVGNQMAAADAHATQLLEQRRQQAEANMKAMEMRTNAYLQSAQKIADTKIDRSVDHPVLAAIAVALGALGSAMKKEGTNPALDALYKAIDRKVDGQVQDLNLKRAGLADQRDALGMQRQQGMDKLTEMDTYRVGYLEQAKRQIETIKAQSQSSIVKANADIALADISQKQAGVTGTAQARWQAQSNTEQAARAAAAQHASTMALTLRGQNLEQKRFEVGLDEKKRERDMLDAEKKAALEEKMRENKAKAGEMAVLDPATGDPMLTPAGLDKMASADSLEAQARKATDPEQSKAILLQAQALRDSAQAKDIATGTSKKAVEDAQKIAGSSHEVANLASGAESLLEGEPSPADRQKWAQIKVKLADVKARYVATLGERVSVRALEAFDDVLSIDADSLFSRGADKGKALAALKELNSDAAEHADTALKSAGIKTKWTPGRRAEPAASFAGKTSEELAADAEPGSITKAATHFLNPLGDTADEKLQAPIEEAKTNANARKNAKGETSNYGLDPQTDDAVRGLLKRSATAGNKAYGDIVEQLAAPLTTDRPGLSAGVAKLIRDEDPKVLDDVLKRVAATAGVPRAQEVAAMIRPVDTTPTASALTPQARSELEYARARGKAGLPTGTYTEPPEIWKALSPEARAKYNEYLKANGFPEVRL